MGFGDSIAKYPYPTPHPSLKHRLLDAHKICPKPMLEQRGLREFKITLLGELDDQCRDTALYHPPRCGDGLDAVFGFVIQPLGLKGNLDGRL